MQRPTLRRPLCQQVRKSRRLHSNLRQISSTSRPYHIALTLPLALASPTFADTRKKTITVSLRDDSAYLIELHSGELDYNLTPGQTLSLKLHLGDEVTTRNSWLDVTSDGVILVGIGVGTLLGLGYAVTGVPHAGLLGSLTAIFAMIPFGAPAALGLACLFLLAQNAVPFAIGLHGRVFET